MDTKTIGGVVCLLLIVIFALAFMTGGNNDTRENMTVTVDGITFTTPVTSNNSTTFTKTDSGDINWEYVDYDNNVSVFISKERLPGYSTTQSFNSVDGYNQIRPIGDRWFLVCADRQDDCEMVFSSAHVE